MALWGEPRPSLKGLHPRQSQEKSHISCVAPLELAAIRARAVQNYLVTLCRWVAAAIAIARRRGRTTCASQPIRRAGAPQTLG